MVRRILCVLGVIAAFALGGCAAVRESAAQAQATDDARQHVIQLIEHKGGYRFDSNWLEFQSGSLTRGSIAINFIQNGSTGRFGYAEFDVSADGNSIKIGCRDVNGNVVDFSEDRGLLDTFTIAGHCGPPLPAPSHT